MPHQQLRRRGPTYCFYSGRSRKIALSGWRDFLLKVQRASPYGKAEPQPWMGLDSGSSSARLFLPVVRRLIIPALGQRADRIVRRVDRFITHRSFSNSGCCPISRWVCLIAERWQIVRSATSFFVLFLQGALAGNLKPMLKTKE